MSNDGTMRMVSPAKMSLACPAVALYGLDESLFYVLARLSRAGALFLRSCRTQVEPNMRVALLILLGLVIGIIGTVNVMNTLDARTPMPRAVMSTMDYHMDALGRALKAGQCNAADIRQHLLRVQSTATDIVPTFGVDEQPFTDAAHVLQTRVQQALQSSPADCPALAVVMNPIREACKSCHQKYR
jgi:cytochrome c556